MLSKRHTKRMVRIAVFAVVMIGIVALALALVGAASEAAGPGGKGNGGKGNGGGNGGGGYGAGQQGGRGAYGDGTGIPVDASDGTGMQYSSSGAYGNGNGNYGAANTMNRQGGGLLLNIPPATPGELSPEVITALHAGLQDEYHAYATYETVIAQFGDVRPFTNIMQSEQTHIDALVFLFERYGLDIPAPSPLVDVPVFASTTEACAAGAAAEIANFELYDSWIAAAEGYPDIAYVFTALRDASEFQHLPAFERCAG